MKPKIRIHKSLFILCIALWLSGCSKSLSMPDDLIEFPVAIYGANNGNFIRYNYQDRTIEKRSLTPELLLPSHFAAYWELKIEDNLVLLSGNKNLVTVDKESFTTTYFPLKNQPCANASSYTSETGINPSGMLFLDEKPALIQNLDVLGDGNMMGLNFNGRCITFDDLPYSINTLLTKKDNTLHVFLHEETLYLTETSTKKPQEIIEKVYDINGKFIHEEHYSTGVSFLALTSLIEVDDKKLALLQDGSSVYLSLLSTEGEGQFMTLEGDPTRSYGPGLWGSSEFRIIDKKLYLLIEDRVYKIDVPSFRIEEEFILSEIEDPSTIHGLKFSDRTMIWIGWDEMYVYDLETFTLLDKGFHGINFYNDDYTITLEINE